MARPFVDSMTPEQMEEAMQRHTIYELARRRGSVKSLAAMYGITPLSMWRRIKRYKEGKDVPRIRSQRT